MTKDICLADITPIIPNDLFKVINGEIKTIIENICKDNGLDNRTILNKYNDDISKIGAKFGVKRRNRRVLSSDLQCMGRKLDGEQCTRGKKDGTDYCKSHQNKLPFGRIDEPFKCKETNKRGRKKKNKMNDYILTHHEIINGQNYLVDDNKFVYSFNINSPEFLGIKVNNEIKKIDFETF